MIYLDTLIAVLGFSALVACGLMTVIGCFFPDEDEIIERRIRAVRDTYPDFDGEIVPFERRAK